MSPSRDYEGCARSDGVTCAWSCPGNAFAAGQEQTCNAEELVGPSFANHHVQQVIDKTKHGVPIATLLIKWSLRPLLHRELEESLVPDLIANSASPEQLNGQVRVLKYALQHRLRTVERSDAQGIVQAGVKREPGLDGDPVEG